MTIALRPPARAYPFVFIAVAASIGFCLFRGFGSILSPKAVPAAVLSVGQSSAAAIGFAVLFTSVLLATHRFFRIAMWKSELLLLQVLPAIWMLLCLAGFKDLEPKGNANSFAFLVLAGFWLFERKRLKTSLLAGRVGTWCTAAVWCITLFLAGMVLLVWVPFSWSGFLVVILGLVVRASMMPVRDPGDGKASAPPVAARRSLRPSIIALVIVAGLGGFLFFTESVPSQSMRAFLGSREAQFRMGWRYREGDGVSQDFSRAALFFEKAAKSGSARAQYDLGILQYYGLGVPETNRGEPSPWLEEAARQDYAPAVTMLALIARRDEHDSPKAMELWRRAALLGDPFAEYLLGTAYLELSSHPADRTEAESERNLMLALFWLEKAKRRSINPVGGLLPQVWSTVPEGSVERITATVFQGLEKGSEP